MKNQENRKQNFGDRLKNIRLEKGFTQVQLGKLSGISNVQITRYEKSITKPTVSAIRKLSNALEVKYDELAGDIFKSTFDLNELDVTVQRLKQLPEQDIIALKEIMDGYIGFKQLTSSFIEVMP